MNRFVLLNFIVVIILVGCKTTANNKLSNVKMYKSSKGIDIQYLWTLQGNRFKLYCNQKYSFGYYNIKNDTIILKPDYSDIKDCFEIRSVSKRNKTSEIKIVNENGGAINWEFLEIFEFDSSYNNNKVILNSNGAISIKETTRGITIVNSISNFKKDVLLPEKNRNNCDYIFKLKFPHCFWNKDLPYNFKSDTLFLKQNKILNGMNSLEETENETDLLNTITEKEKSTDNWNLIKCNIQRANGMGDKYFCD